MTASFLSVASTSKIIAWGIKVFKKRGPGIADALHNECTCGGLFSYF